MAASGSPASFEETAEVSEVIKRAGLELRDLLARREEVSIRIRDLRVAVGALKKYIATTTQNEPVATRPLSNEKNGPFPAEAKPYGSARSGSGSPKATPQIFKSQSLRRACRIALLESDDASSAKKICQRILQRGSFSFPNPEGAISAISSELNSMVEDGEVLRITSRAGATWQRIFSRDPDGWTGLAE